MVSGTRKHRWWWAALVVVLIALGLWWAVRWALRTPAGRAAANVAEYYVRVARDKWPGRAPASVRAGGAIGGVVRDEEGRPLGDALVLVATVRGVVYQAHSDDLGTYRIENIPPGRYVPVAGKWGYDDALYHHPEEERTAVDVRAGQLASGIDMALAEHRPWRPVLDEPPLVGPPQIGYALFPAEVSASRTAVTYTHEGLLITTTLLYEPLGVEITRPLPVVVACYPAFPLNWDRVSVAMASEGYVVLATGPNPYRGMDIAGLGRDLLKAVAYLRDGQLTVRADAGREVWLTGSFSSLVLFHALREEPGGIDAIVTVGGIYDAFLGVQSLYETELQIPPQYAAAIAALDPPDRYPEFYLGYSPAFFAAHIPRALIVHTTADEVIPYNQSQRFAQALAAAGVEHELFLYEDTTHYLDQVNVTPDTAELYRRLIAFLDQTQH
jgi:hypothetical protein